MKQTTSTKGRGMTADEITKALQRAFSLGQTYWQQAESDAIFRKFAALVRSTVASLTSGKGS